MAPPELLALGAAFAFPLDDLEQLGSVIEAGIRLLSPEPYCALRLPSPDGWPDAPSALEAFKWAAGEGARIYETWADETLPASERDLAAGRLSGLLAQAGQHLSLAFPVVVQTAQENTRRWRITHPEEAWAPVTLEGRKREAARQARLREVEAGL